MRRASPSASCISAIARHSFAVDSPIGPAGSTWRGHEFHYAALVGSGNDEPLADLSDGQGRPLGTSGGRRGHVTGAFFHAIAPAEFSR